MFSAGIDLSDVGVLSNAGANDSRQVDVARRALGVMREGGEWQRAWRAINLCSKPVIACVHGGCLGAALEMICFCDIRLCTEDAYFKAPEVDLGLAADIGGNQMFPKIIGNDSLLRELQMTGRTLPADEALSFGLVSRVLKDQGELMRIANEMASAIASKSPVAMLGVKTMLNFTRDHSVDDSLQFGITWNSAMLQTDDVKEAGTSFMMKKAPVFQDASSMIPRSKL